jgi:hypothetical protein
MAIQYVDDDTPLSIAWDISDSAYFTHDYLDRLRLSLIEIQNIVEGKPSTNAAIEAVRRELSHINT